MSDVRITADGCTVSGTEYRSNSFERMLDAFGTSELVLASAETQTIDGLGVIVTGKRPVPAPAGLLGKMLDGARLSLAGGGGEPTRFQLAVTLSPLSLGDLATAGVLPTAGATGLTALQTLEFTACEAVWSSDGDQLYFRQLASTHELDLFHAAGVGLQEIGFEFLRDYAAGKADLRVHAGLVLGTSRVECVLRVPLGSMLEPRTWELAVKRPYQLTGGLQDLLAFLEGTTIGGAIGVSSWAGQFPDELRTWPSVFIDWVEIHLDPGSESVITFVGFAVQSPNKLTLTSGMTIEQVGTRMALNLAATSPRPLIKVFGLLGVGSRARFDVSVTLPAHWSVDPWKFEMHGAVNLAGLAEVSSLPIHTPLADLGFPSAMLSVTDVQVSRFEVEFDRSGSVVGSVELDVELAGQLSLVHGLAVHHPSTTFHIRNPFGAAGRDPRLLTGSIGASIEVGSLALALEAEKTATGWSFTCTRESGGVQIGELFQALADKFDVQLHESLRGMELADLTLTFTTTSGEEADDEASALLFHCTGTFPLDGKEADVTVNLTVDKDANGDYSVAAAGTLTVGTRTFSLAFSEDPASTLLVASYGNPGGETLKVRDDLVAHVSTSLGSFVPAELEIDFRSVVFALERTAAPDPDPDTDADPATVTTWLAAVEVGAELDLTGLPLVGAELPAEAQVQVKSLQVAVASGPLTGAQVAGINARLPAAVAPLPSTPLAQGVNVGAALRFGGEPRAVSMPVAAPGTTPAAAPAPATPPAGVTATDGARWIDVQKVFGPVHLDRVGVRYSGGAAWFLLDAALSAAGLTLSLQGLAFGSPLDEFAPRFDLQGIGIDYSNGGVEIGGTFLRQTATDAEGETYDAYAGAAVLRTDAFALSALGSYARLDGHPSLFVYAVLDRPLGGPAFAFVTGLAAGFGYNRALAVPTLDGVADFPLVKAALDGSDPPQSTAEVGTALASLAPYLAPRVGEVFVAAGVRFSSFKLVDSFVLAVVQFGRETEVDVLGLSTLVLPTPVPGETATPLARAQLALRATYHPSQGVLAVAAQLTGGSYVLSRACRLTGGFAFYTWFAGEHAGDFVLSLGGYHPAFQVPSHYPAVPRLGLAWTVSEHLSVEGSLYCALTPSLLMAGGELKAVYQDGSLQASFTAGMDAAIAWKPYHYEFQAYVDVAVQYTYHIPLLGTHHLDVEVGAGLSCWGPDFAGQVHVDLDVVSFTVPFGASAPVSPAPISWDAFAASFLPGGDVCTVAATGGMQAGAGGTDLGTVDPRRLRLVTATAIPSSALSLRDAAAPLAGGVNLGDDGEQPAAISWSAHSAAWLQAPGKSSHLLPPPGVGPVGVAAGALASTHSVWVDRQVGTVWQAAETDFAFTPVLKDVPYALWGSDRVPAVNGPRLLQGALAGVAITPAAEPAPGLSAVVDAANLAFDADELADAYAWGTAEAAFVPSTADAATRLAQIRDTLASTAAVQARASLCTALNVTPGTLYHTDALNAAAALLAVPALSTT